MSDFDRETARLMQGYMGDEPYPDSEPGENAVYDLVAERRLRDGRRNPGAATVEDDYSEESGD